MNPILEKIRAIDARSLKSPTVYSGAELLEHRTIDKLFRRQSAADWLGTLTPNCHRFGITKGQFSLVDLIRHITTQTGPVEFSLSTWTVAHADLSELAELMQPDRIISCRFLLDFSFQRRQPALLAHIRQTFGPEAVVVTRNHCKFCLFKNSNWTLVLRTSMNLNFNPRLEDVDLANDPQLYQFLDTILREIFKTHQDRRQERQTTAQLAADFARLVT